MILHVVNQAPDAGRTLEQVLSAMADDDCLLLIEDGVVGAMPTLAALFTALEGRRYVLREDLESRGLLGRQPEGFAIVDIDGFVNLTEEAAKTVSWY
ncbi:sulfurtransferase complex subunit TusB [Halomonas sp. 18H]|uniref:sulfurtransferase complex subunit TusB n=1 Tax=Halomonas almeriensis TaxID=308163 RepID=UPI002230240B|nr:MULTISPECIES: sulfurtransferase complex subunit TusB [Halomonas]MCW4151898.1 sulfurtransferase complex subunit TusB [Halomonas sp. 18H]MDN3554144.1 sulfurtransferase complex subunit TusB [Halomonas almeriensis]